MDFFDLVFPLNIGPLTYCWPSRRGRLSPGMIVEAEVKKSMHYGVVIGNAAAKPSGPLKEIADVVLERPAISTSLLRLLRWMAEYYIAHEGAVLKSMGVMEHFATAKRKRAPRAQPEGSREAGSRATLPPVSADFASPVRASLSGKEYRTFLLHAPTMSHEIAALLSVSDGVRDIIILVPEITHIDLLLPALADLGRERLAILHGRLSAGQRKAALERIISGDADIVLGTRIAAFAPLPSLSLIAVLQEQNRSYKNLEGVRYHARDVAVMRGYLGKSTVTLSSTAPSMESFHNAEKGKYTLLAAQQQVHLPKIEVITMRTARKATSHLALRSVRAASAALNRGESVLFFINRKGYSLIECAECATVLSCPHCAIPLIYHKSNSALKCHYCTHTSRVPETCATCRSTQLQTVGAGTQRIEAELKGCLDREPLRLDSDAFREDPQLRARAAVLQGDELIVGTRAVSGRLQRQGTYGLCVFLNPDIGLHLPDFRSSELLFQEIVNISEFVKPDGLVIIQTNMPENHVFKFIRGYRVKDFVTAELALRKSLSYPPFSRIIVLRASSGTDMTATVVKALTPADGTTEIIGPSHTTEKGAHIWRVILKSAEKQKLGVYARRIVSSLRQEKGLRIVVDVDPISM